jgi:hypothetical protein
MQFPFEGDHVGVRSETLEFVLLFQRAGGRCWATVFQYVAAQKLSPHTKTGRDVIQPAETRFGVG